MTYQSYVDKLHDLLNFQWKLVSIQQDEVFLFAEDFLRRIKRKDLEKIGDIKSNYLQLINSYADAIKEKLYNIDRKNLSIKKILPIMQGFAETLFTSIDCLQVMIDNVNKDLRYNPITLNLIKAINNFNDYYSRLKFCTQLLNITYNEDYTKISFDLHFIDDKSVNDIDLDKVLIPDNFEFTFEDRYDL